MKKPSTMRATDQSASKASSAEFGRYVIAGIINTLVSLIVYSVLVTYTPLQFWIANFFATIAGIMCGFFLSRIFVFTNSETSAGYSGPRYLITIGLQYLVSTAAIGVLIYFGTAEIPAYILVLPLAVGLSFILQKTWVFPNTNSSEE